MISTHNPVVSFPRVHAQKEQKKLGGGGEGGNVESFPSAQKLLFAFHTCLERE